MPPRTVLPASSVLLRMKEEENIPVIKIAERYSVTPNAVYYRLKQAKHATIEDGLLPWRVEGKHQGSLWHRAALAHARWSRGDAVDQVEKTDALALRDFCASARSVLIYDATNGFRWRRKRREDVDILGVE